jgi:Raf kinase inhibitor-like YbhB/YbcL family protein
LSVAEFGLQSSAFENGEPIPRRHSCEGQDLSPPLSWSGAPEGTRSLALVVDDPDAPTRTFTHWLGWGLDPGAGAWRGGGRTG